MSESITSQEQRVADGARRVSKADLVEWRSEVEQFLAAQKQELATLLENVTSTSIRQAPPNEWGIK